MKLKRKLILGVVFVLINSFGCQKELAKCTCSEIEIYEISLDINFPIRQHEGQLREMGVSRKIKDLNLISEIKEELLTLEEEPIGDDAMDVRVVLDFRCENDRKSTILLNNLEVKIGKKYFKPSEDLLNLISK